MFERSQLPESGIVLITECFFIVVQDGVPAETIRQMAQCLGEGLAENDI